MGLLDQLSDQQREAVQTIDDDLEIILNENWFEQDKWDERTRTAYKKFW